MPTDAITTTATTREAAVTGMPNVTYSSKPPAGLVYTVKAHPPTKR